MRFLPGGFPHDGIIAWRDWTACPRHELGKNEVGKSGDEVYRLTSGARNFYLKVKRIEKEAAAETLRRESEVLNWLKGRLPVPEAVCYHQDRSKEYLLITEVPGFAAMETGWDKKKVVCRLAEGLRRIHSLPIDSCPFVYPTGALIRLAAERIRAGLVDEEDFDECRKGKRAEELYEELVRSRPARDDLVFTHGDYCLPNVILSDSGIGGFIDWGRGGVADRYRDLGIAARSITHNLGEGYVPYFFGFYGLKRVDFKKVKFFQLMDEFF